MPRIVQLLLGPPRGLSDDEAEWRAYRARRKAERAGGAYIASLSFRTVTYKALCAAHELGEFYLDLKRPELEVPFGIFHQRFSTNTMPSWERAQPFRFLCHNGEINAIQGNVNWMRAREGNFGTADDELYHPVLDEAGSDSAMLDNALDFIVHGGRDVRHAIAMLIPPAWEGNPELPQEVRDFYRYHSGLIEPWDGPAGVVFTDGRAVGATLDRNGLRPLRYAICEDGLVVCSSEAGAVPLEGHGSVKRGKLGPGQMIAVDPRRGFEDDPRIKSWLAAKDPYGTWLEEGLIRGAAGGPIAAPEGELTPRQARFGYTREELPTFFLRTIASHGHDPTYSMGDDTALAPLAGRPRPLYHYFRQRFAQVTNPPIDHLRERFVMSLRTVLGSRAPLLSNGPEVAGGIELRQLLPLPRCARPVRGHPPGRDARPRRGAACRVRAPGRGGRDRRPRRRRHAADLGHDSRPRSDSGAARDRRRPSPARAQPAADEGDARRGDRRGPRGAPLRLPARLRRRGDLPAARPRDPCPDGSCGQDRRRPALAGGGAAAPEAGRRGRRAQGDVEDGDLGHRKLQRRPGVRGDRAGGGGGRAAFAGTPCPVGGIGFAEARAGDRRARRGRGGGVEAREPRLLQVAQGRGAPRDERGRRGRAARAGGRPQAPQGGRARVPAASGSTATTCTRATRSSSPGARRWSRATCSRSCRPGHLCRSTRSRASTRSSVASRAARCRTERCPRRRTRRSRSP